MIPSQFFFSDNEGFNIAWPEHFRAVENCSGCLDWNQFGTLRNEKFPKRCKCGGLIHYTQECFDTEEGGDGDLVSQIIQCDKCDFREVY